LLVVADEFRPHLILVDGWSVFDHGDPIVYVAKNGIGSDSIEDSKRMKIDEELANSLTKWMRIIASTMKRPAIDKDQMWTKLIS
jgi:hypothetical protein